jgi:hypothetical protein
MAQRMPIPLLVAGGWIILDFFKGILCCLFFPKYSLLNVIATAFQLHPLCALPQHFK